MLYGEHDRGEAARRVARAQELYPQLDVRLLPHAAHLAQWDAAAPFADIAARFLGKPYQRIPRKQVRKR